MKNNIFLSCLLAAIVPGLAFAAPQKGKGHRNIDSNGDGALSYDEASAAGMQRLVDNFDRIDRNRDGLITRDEMQQLRRERVEKGQRSGQGKGDRPRNGKGDRPRDGQGQGRK